MGTLQICICFVAIFIQGGLGVTVILKPIDTAREIGSNVTLACIVTDKAQSESVQWKHKPEGSDAFNALTFNENVLSNPAKYDIKWTYNLTIYRIEPRDSGLYRCTAGGVDYDAILSVVDLPKNVSIEMIGEPVNGETHNLTCRASNSLPPPTIKWIINGVDLTSNAVMENGSLTAEGYGDITSYLTLDLDESMNGRVAECILSYRGWDNAVKATYTITTTYPGGYSNTGYFNPGTIVFPSSGGGPNTATSGGHTAGSAFGTGGGRPAGSGVVPPKGMFMIRFLKQGANENINWELQQYQP